MLTLPTNQSKPCATKAGSCGSLLPKTFSAKPWSLLTPLRGNSSLPLLRPLTILLFLLELTFWNFHFPPCALMFFQHQSVHGTKTLGRKKPWELWIIQLWLTQDIPNNQGSYCWCPPGVSPCVFPRAGAGTVAVSEAVQQVTHLSLSLSLSPAIFSNHSSATSAFPSSGEHGGDTNLLVSPLLVAGVVIGLVLFLSCATIVVGSLRKDSRLGQPRLPREAADGKGEGPGNAWIRAAKNTQLLQGMEKWNGSSHGQLGSVMASLCWDGFPQHIP